VIFYKTVTFGNDFIHIDIDEYESLKAPGVTKSRLARKVCSRHEGAGADGVVFYKLSNETNPVSFEIYNRDGSEAELSGNGMAGLSALIFHLNRSQFQDHVLLDTKSGLKKNYCLFRNKNKFRLKIEIGEANFQNNYLFPFLKKGQMNYQHKGIDFYPVSVGNPHVVVLVEKVLDTEEIEKIGHMLEEASIFPYKTNVEFVLPGKGPANYEKGENFRILFYERGVGQTCCSSTGSSAVFAVLKKLSLIEDSLTIPYIEDSITISGKNEIYVENSTEIVYKCIFLS
jgi:diaminopimelate epimerase